MLGTSTKKSSKPPRIDVPITAMLDMSFQLLFFFLLNYSPSHVEGQMDLALPSRPAAGGANQGQPPAPPVADALVLPADLTITVRAVKDGGPAHGMPGAISVRSRSGEQVVPTFEALTEQLEKSRDRLDNKNDVTIVADSALRWSEMVKVVDACRKARFRAGFGAPPDLNLAQ